jgi:hypothetical protein
MTLMHSLTDIGRDQPEDPIPVLLIACAGRSGSTLLDRIIGMYDGFWSAGELRYIWERSFRENQLCGCGVPFANCSFWEEVSLRAFGGNANQVDATTAIRLWRSLDEIRQTPRLIKSHNPPGFDAALWIYGQLFEHLYRGIRDISGARVIVDSSGDATHGLILAKIPNIDLHVIHLVRDPRAVAFSWKRERRRPEIHWTSQDMPIQDAKTSAILWMAHNAIAELLSKSAASYCRLRYEDFVANPYGVLSRIMAPYGPIKSQPAGLISGEVVLRPTHTVSGNPLRFKQGPLKIRLDDEWRDAMLARDRQTVTAVTLPLLTRYGYPVRSSA